MRWPRSVTVSIGNTKPTSASAPTGTTLTSLTATLSLSVIPGFTYTPNSLSTIVTPGSSVTYQGGGTSPLFGLPDLAYGERLEFTVQLEASCASLGTAQAGTVNRFPVVLTYTGGESTFTDNSPSFELVNPALSITRLVGNNVPGLVKTGTDALLFDVTGTLLIRLAFGLPTAAMATWINIYWVKKHPYAQIVGVKVGNLALTQIGDDAPKVYFRVSGAAIARAGTPAQNTGLFQFNEILDFTETWQVTGCPLTTTPDLERGVQWGCNAANPLAACESTAFPTGIRFGRIRPVLTAYEAWNLLSDAKKKSGGTGLLQTRKNPATAVYH